jgi:NAD(P)-dependent dehydrogenase (short-subunit alcohol dehydrogenase family)
MSEETDPLAAFALTGKAAIVTGAGSGVGKATARLFAAAGAKVVLADINLPAAEAVAGELEGAIAVHVDIADEASVQAMFAAALTAFGRVDVLVNNAAFRPKADFMEMSVEQWDHMHAVNTRGAFLCTREAVRAMRETGGGAIVNVSSVSARRPTVFANTHYDSSKAGVDAITRACAVEFAGDGIRVNSVLPGGVDTEGGAAIRASGLVVKGPITMPGRVVLRRIAQPVELARAILFLASDASSFITGHELVVDGGYSVG